MSLNELERGSRFGILITARVAAYELCLRADNRVGDERGLSKCLRCGDSEGSVRALDIQERQR